MEKSSNLYESHVGSVATPLRDISDDPLPTFIFPFSHLEHHDVVSEGSREGSRDVGSSHT